MERGPLYPRRGATRFETLLTLIAAATGLLITGPIAYVLVLEYELWGGLAIWAVYLAVAFAAWRLLHLGTAPPLRRIPLLAWLAGSLIVFLYLVNQATV